MPIGLPGMRSRTCIRAPVYAVASPVTRRARSTEGASRGVGVIASRAAPLAPRYQARRHIAKLDSGNIEKSLGSLQIPSLGLLQPMRARGCGADREFEDHPPVAAARGAHRWAAIATGRPAAARTIRAFGRRRGRSRLMRHRAMRRQALVIGEGIVEFGAGGVIVGSRRRRRQSRKTRDARKGDRKNCEMSCSWRHAYPRKTAPVFLATSATILATAASISASVNVRSRGCNVTAMATDLWPLGTPWPS